MPEIDMGVHLHPGMVALLQARLPLQTVHEVVVTGKRYGAEDALAARIVERALPEDQLLPAAIAAAAEMSSKANSAMGRLKRGLYGPALEALAEMPPDLFS
jgi:enoyl-CoA hydratase/carnithine racemase